MSKAFIHAGEVCSRSVVGSVIALLSVSGTAFAGVSNGSFEVGLNDNPSHPAGWTVFGAESPDNVARIGPAQPWFFSKPIGEFISPADGEWMLAMWGTAQQTVHLEAGESIEFNTRTIGGPLGGILGTVAYSITSGSTVVRLEVEAVDYFNDWNTVTLTAPFSGEWSFVGGIAFQPGNGEGAAVLLDDVRVVPVPGVAGLLGAAGLLAVRRQPRLCSPVTRS